MGIKSKTLFNKIRRNNPYFEDFITRSIYNSNAIEGNTLSYYDTYAILFNDNSVMINARPKELYEAINLKYAMNYVLKNIEVELNLPMIKKIGILINKNINDIDNFRNTQVFIRGARHVPPNPCDVSRLLSELIYKSSSEKSGSIFKDVAKFHIEFEKIHPFIDGNGRTGRLLISKELMKKGLAPVVIPIELRSEYMELLNNDNVNGLTSLLIELNNFERERMKKFGIKV